MLDTMSSRSGIKRIDYLQREPLDPPKITTFFLPGIYTTGAQYHEFLSSLANREERIIVPFPHEGRNPVQSIEQNAALFMTLYRRLQGSTLSPGHPAAGRIIDLSRHIIIGYSLGARTALVLGADTSPDHQQTERIICINPPAPGQELTLLDYSTRFLSMARKLLDGKEGDTGKAFALQYGTDFVRQATFHPTTTMHLLRSINASMLEPGSVDIPVTLIMSGDDEFSDPAQTRAFYEQVCTTLDVHVIPGISHARILHHPREISNIVLDAYTP